MLCLLVFYFVFLGANKIRKEARFKLFAAWLLIVFHRRRCLLIDSILLFGISTAVFPGALAQFVGGVLGTHGGRLVVN